MTRVVSVGRSKSLFALLGTGLASIAIGWTGCAPGTLDNPDAFPAPVTGTAGTNPGAAGTTGGGGTSGTAGTGTGVPPGCDRAPMIIQNPDPTSYSCTLALACHDAMGSGAKLDLTSPNVATRLVGVVPKTGGNSICANDMMFKTMPYIIPKSSPADGLLLRKLKGAVCAPMGAQMPTLNGPMKPADLLCIQQWADKLAQQ